MGRAASNRFYVAKLAPLRECVLSFSFSFISSLCYGANYDGTILISQTPLW